MKKQKLALPALISLLLLLSIAACIKEEDEPNQTPTCIITSPADEQEIAKGDTVTILVEATDANGSIAEVSFSVDGTKKDSTNNYPYTFYWTTANESIGTHVLQATSVDNLGDSSSNEISIILVDYSPLAIFSVNPTGGTAPLTVNFTDQSSNYPTHYQWNFGDGDTSNQQNPTHTYNYGGTFTVALTVSNNINSDTATEIIVVEANTGTYTDSRDNQTYNTIVIGTQTWFAENLNYETDISSCYNYHPTNCNIYGRLYNGDMALYACPNGWHLPSDDEWKTLEIALGMSQSEADDTDLRGIDEGEKMKSTSSWNSNGNGTNSSGFNALAGGYRGSVGSNFYNLGNHGCWWSSTAYISTSIWARSLSYNSNKVNRDYFNKAFRYSVRCVKD